MGNEFVLLKNLFRKNNIHYTNIFYSLLTE